MDADVQPPLTSGRRRRFWPVLDYVAAAGCALIIFAVLLHEDVGPQLSLVLMSSRVVFAGLIAIALSVPVAFRRRAPARALAVVLAGCLVTLIAGGQLSGGPFLPLALVLYLTAATCRRRVALYGLAAALGLLLVQALIIRLTGQGPGNPVAAGLVLVITFMVGSAVQQRRIYLAHLRDRAASDAVTAERLRIARELHDVVAHSMTVVTVQAGFGEYVFDSQPTEARAALGAIQAVSREALGEMQRLLCVLRESSPGSAAPTATGTSAVPATQAVRTPAGAQTDGARAPGTRPQPPLAPAPGLASLDRLVERTAGAAVRVTVERTGTLRPVPAGLDLSAFRIVQEALTNVVKHSGADSCHVLVDYGPDALLVQVTDHGPAVPAAAGAGAGTPGPGTGARPPTRTAVLPRGTEPRAGHGIAGMRERVSLCGGEFSAQPRPGGGFVVRARLPLPGRTP